MKTATIQELPLQWTDILRWVSAGEEVRITDHDKTVARVLPPAPVGPDFLSRARAIWGGQPDGKPLSALVEEGRGSRRSSGCRSLDILHRALAAVFRPASLSPQTDGRAN